MDKTLMGVLGAVSSLAIVPAAQASTPVAIDPPQVMQARSFADLLAPIPNASATLRALDEARASAPAGVEVAQYDDGYGGGGYGGGGYHHHHHHHYRPAYHPPVYRPTYHHHHHYRPAPSYHHHYQQPSYNNDGY